MARAKSEYAVEKQLMSQLSSMGYTPVKLSTYLDVMENLRQQICIANASALIEAKGEATLSDAEFERIKYRLLGPHLLGRTVYESAKILREEWVLLLDNGKTAYIRFLHDDPSKNTYQVANQITMNRDQLPAVVRNSRYDVTGLVNGFPLIQVELKKPGVDWGQAFNQVNRYRRTSYCGLFCYIQIFVVSNGSITKYFANVNEKKPDGSNYDIPKSMSFYWTDVDNKVIARLTPFVEDFLSIHRITELLTRYTVIKASEPLTLIARPYQYWCVKLSASRVLDSKLDGYNYGATGCGKTLSSFLLAKTLDDSPDIERTFLLVDRKDLDDQTVDEYNSFCPDCVDNTDSTKALVEALGDSSKTLIIVTIQKLACALRSPRYAKMMEKYHDLRCVFIIDECHRSQFGKMHADIQRHFHNANYIGFTGTPRFEENKSADGKTTADLFHSGELDPCIHRYMITNAIADKNVLPFLVEYISSINIDGIRRYGLDPDRIADPEYRRIHNVDMDKLYHDDTRIALVAQDILDRIEGCIQPGTSDRYTAIFATDRISTLMRYYREMKERKPDDLHIAAIFTYSPNADFDEGQDELASDYLTECMDDYNETYGTAYDISTFDAYRKDVAKRMRQRNTDGQRIDLLIVVDMFLTGFDSKPTNTLFLDKDLKWHNLLQAFSRTNRVDKPTKQMGHIISYRDMKKAQDDAFRLFSGGGDPNAYLVQPYSNYLSAYIEHAEELRQVAPTPDDACYLADEEEQRRFLYAFRKLVHDLRTMVTFSEFDWSDIDGVLDEEEFMDYKSWYLNFYNDYKRKVRKGQDTLLVDVDFEIAFVRTDTVNVRYIMALLKDINRSDKDEMKKAVDLIIRELEHSDNGTVQRKRDTLRRFMETRFYELEPDADIEAEFALYEEQEIEATIDDFACRNDVDREVIADLLTESLSNQTQVTLEDIRQRLKDRKLPLIKMTRLAKAINEFLDDMLDSLAEDEG